MCAWYWIIDTRVCTYDRKEACGGVQPVTEEGIQGDKGDGCQQAEDGEELVQVNRPFDVRLQGWWVEETAIRTRAPTPLNTQ